MEDGCGIAGSPARGWACIVDFLHPLRRQMRVDLRGAQALMAQQFLHAAQIGAVVQQVRGEAVPQRVRADAGIEAGGQEIFVELAADRSRARAIRRAC